MSEIERATYAGLTISDKTALLDAKARGAEWVANDSDGSTYWYETEPVPSAYFVVKWTNKRGAYGRTEHAMNAEITGPVHIPTALAQIAKMESRAFNAMLPIYLDRANEHIAKIESAEKPMTNRDALIRKWSEDVESMAKRLIESDLEDCGYFFDSVETRSGRAYADCYQVALDGEIAFLNSPYTEGETK